MGMFDSYRNQGGLLGLAPPSGLAPNQTYAPAAYEVLDKYAGAEAPQATPVAMPEQQAPVVRPPQPAPVDPQQQLREQAAADTVAGYRSLGLPPQAFTVAQATGVTPLQAMSALRYSPGRAAITTADLDRMNQQATYVRQGGSVSTVGAGKYDPEQINDLTLDRKLAAVDQADAAQMAADADVSAQWRQAQTLMSNAAARQTELDNRGAKLGEQVAQARADEDAASKQEIQGLFARKGTLRGALMMIGGALEKFANTRQGISGPTTADRLMQADMAEQERQINMRGANARNRLADLMRETGSLDQARAQLAIEQREALASNLSAQAAKARLPAVRANLEAGLKATLADLTAKRMDMEAANQGTTTVTSQGAYMQPRAGTRGGMTWDYNKLAGMQHEANKERLDYDVEAMKAGAAKQGKGDETFIQYGNKRNELESSADAAEALLRRIGAKKDENGQWSATGDVPGYGIVAGRIPTGDSLMGLAGEALLSEDGKRVRNEISMAKAQLVNAMSGAGVSDKEREMYDNMVNGANTGGSIVRGLSMMANRARQQVLNLEATYGSDAARRYEGQKGVAAVRQRAKDTDQATGAQPWTPAPVKGGARGR